MAEDKTQAAGKEAHDLAKDAKAKQVGESPDVALAAEGREDSIERVDKLADDMESDSGRRSSRRPEARFAGKSFVALHAILRNGSPVYPGDAVKFDADEDQHVGDLLQAGVIVEGSEGSEGSKEVEAALGKADLARGRALAQSGGLSPPLLTFFIVLCIIAVLITLGGGYGDRYWRFGSYQPWIGLLVFLLILWLIFHFLLGVF